MDYRRIPCPAVTNRAPDKPYCNATLIFVAPDTRNVSMARVCHRCHAFVKIRIDDRGNCLLEVCENDHVYAPNLPVIASTVGAMEAPQS